MKIKTKTIKVIFKVLRNVFAIVGVVGTYNYLVKTARKEVDYDVTDEEYVMSDDDEFDEYSEKQESSGN